MAMSSPAAASLQVFPDALRHVSKRQPPGPRYLQADKQRDGKPLAGHGLVALPEPPHAVQVVYGLSDEEVRAGQELAMSQPGLPLDVPAQVKSSSHAEIGG